MAADQLKVVGQGGNMAVSAPELRLTNEVPFPYIFKMWKIQNFSFTQILREIKVDETKVSKSAILKL